MVTQEADGDRNTLVREFPFSSRGIAKDSGYDKRPHGLSVFVLKNPIFSICQYEHKIGSLRALQNFFALS